MNVACAARVETGEGARCERLFDPYSERALTELGVEAGWRCLDLSTQTASIARWLSRKVESSGEVHLAGGSEPATDAPPENLEVLGEGPFETAAYDLVHARDVLSAQADPAAFLARLADAVRPGGWLCVSEYDFGALAAVDPASPDTRALDRGLQAGVQALSADGRHFLGCGSRLPALMRGLRFARVAVSSHLMFGETGEHPLARWCVERLRSAQPQGLPPGRRRTDPVARLLKLLDTPGQSFVGPALVIARVQRPFFTRE